MCITFYCLDPVDPYSLILTMNRDEFYSRPTSSAAWSSDGLLGGWDQEPGREGGTWLALDKTGRVGFLTNIFVGSGPDPQAAGRGFLVTDWLKSNSSAQGYLEQLSSSDTVYNPFNLVLFEPVNGRYEAWSYSRGKVGHTDNCGPFKSTIGVGGVSNHPLSKTFSKTKAGTSKLDTLVKNVPDQNQLFVSLEKIMNDSTSNWPDDQIKEQNSNCKPEFFLEAYSSIFIDKLKKFDYGTRTTTTVLVKNMKTVIFREKHWNDEKEINHEFCIHLT